MHLARRDRDLPTNDRERAPACKSFSATLQDAGDEWKIDMYSSKQKA